MLGMTMRKMAVTMMMTGTFANFFLCHLNLECSGLYEELLMSSLPLYCCQWWNPPLKLSHMITQGNPGYTLGFDNPGYTLGFEP